jgi:hypothetical protein
MFKKLIVYFILIYFILGISNAATLTQNEKLILLPVKK